jgi:chloramphenicol 3-O phosphotransferase
MAQGNIVLLNGTSSAGKTSITRALQEIMEAPYFHTSVDHYLGRLPPRLFAVSDGISPATSDYFLLVYEGVVQRMVEARDEGTAVYGPGTFTGLRIGPEGVRLLAGMYQAIAALAKAGINVVVADVIHDRRVLRAAVEALPARHVLFVGLQLPRDVAERRERERGDRGPGAAAAFYDLVHAHGIYDLMLDTAITSPMACAEQIKEVLQNGQPRHAFAELARTLAERIP